MSAPGAGGHAEHGGIGDYSSVTWVVSFLAGKGSGAKFVADIILKDLPGVLPSSTGVSISRNVFVGSPGLFDCPGEGDSFFPLCGSKSPGQLFFRNIEATGRSGDLFCAQGSIVKAGSCDADMEMLVSSGWQMAETKDDGTPALGKSG